MFKVASTELPLMELVAELGNDMIANDGVDATDISPLEYYGSQFMQNHSEAGYSEARPTGRRSVRALANVVRVTPSEMKALKSLLNYSRGDYHDVAVAMTIASAIGKWERTALAAKLLVPPQTVKWNGPFYPHIKEMRLKTDSNWMFHCTLVGKRTPEMRESMAALAGLFRVNQSDLDKIAKRMVDLGCEGEELHHNLVEVVVESVRTCHRFWHGMAFI